MGMRFTLNEHQYGNETCLLDKYWHGNETDWIVDDTRMVTHWTGSGMGMRPMLLWLATERICRQVKSVLKKLCIVMVKESSHSLL